MNRTDFPFENLMRNFDIRTYWKKFFNPQFFISYNTQDEAVENHVLSEVGSYGKQLGVIIDVLNVLIDHAPLDALTPQQQHTMVEFRQLSTDVEMAVASFENPAEKNTLQAFNLLIGELPLLARSDPQLITLLRKAIDEVGG